MDSYSFQKNRIQPSSRKTFWNHYSEPTKEEFAKLQEDFNLTDEFIEGLSDEHEIPQIEIGKNHTTMFIQIPMRISGQIRTFPFALIYSKGKLTTICERKNDYLDAIFTIKFEERTVQQLIIELLYIVEEEYEKCIKILSKRIRQKKLNISTLANQDIIELVELEDILNNIITSAVPNTTIYARILQRNALSFSDDDQTSFQDVINSAKQTIEQARLAIKTVQNIRNAYSTIMTNNLNTVMKVLTATTIILALPTLLSSMYGMNITLPFQQHPNAFLLVMSICILASTCVFLVFRIKRWL